MRSRTWSVATALFVTFGLTPDLLAEPVMYSISGDVDVVESGSFRQVTTNPDGSPHVVDASFSGRIGTLSFAYEFWADPDDPDFLGTASGAFRAGDLTMQASEVRAFVTAFEDNAEGVGPDVLGLYAEDLVAGPDVCGTFYLLDPTGRFFETGDLTGVVVRSAVTVTRSLVRPGPDYDATGLSASLSPVPEPSSMLMAGFAAVAVLGAARTRRRAAR